MNITLLKPIDIGTLSVVVLFIYAPKSYEVHGSKPQGFDLIMIFKWTIFQEEIKDNQ